MQAKSAGHSRLVVIWRTRILATLVVLASVDGPAQSFAQTDATYSDGRVNQPSDGQTRKQAAQRLLSTMTDATNNDTVGRLIDSLVASDRETVQAAVTALVLLGRPAVPEMIRRIDDRREMPVKVVALDNTEPSAFEAVAHLGVDKVIDCLNLILTSTERKIVGHIDADPVDPNDAGSKHMPEAHAMPSPQDGGDILRDFHTHHLHLESLSLFRAHVCASTCRFDAVRDLPSGRLFTRSGRLGVTR